MPLRPSDVISRSKVEIFRDDNAASIVFLPMLFMKIENFGRVSFPINLSRIVHCSRRNDLPSKSDYCSRTETTESIEFKNSCKLFPSLP